MHSASLIRFLIIFILIFLFDLYVFNGFKAAFTTSRFRLLSNISYWGVTAIFFATILSIFLFARTEDGPGHPLFKFTVGFFMLFYVPKLIMFLFFGIEDVYRLLRATGVGVANLLGSELFIDAPYFESRRWFISRFAGLVALIPAVGIVYGIARGRYNFKVHRRELYFKELPEAFDGFTITQISDLHIGSFDDREPLERAAEIIRRETSDLLVFTGDMVNNRATEIEPWLDIFKDINATSGKYSILGNHDYGDYTSWNSAEEKQSNLNDLHNHYQILGFDLLRNESRRIEKDGQFIELLGMENWGRGFAQYGDFTKTLSSTVQNSFKILLSHDPTHWEEEVLAHDQHIHLTLSGHTHGAQFGVEIPGFRFSPVQLRYKRWAGLYTERERNLYVNRGLGYIAFPGRVGIWPEITVLTLRKA